MTRIIMFIWFERKCISSVHMIFQIAMSFASWNRNLVILLTFQHANMHVHFEILSV